MLTIRFFRTGKKNQPSFKIVVTDKRKSSTRGRFVEQVGFYNPLKKEKNLNAERIKYWISVGAQPSDTVRNLFISEKIIEGKKVDVHKKPKKTEVAPTGEVKAEAKPAEPQEKPTEVKPVEEKKADVPSDVSTEAPPAGGAKGETSAKAEEKKEEKPKEEPKTENPPQETPK